MSKENVKTQKKPYNSDSLKKINWVGEWESIPFTADPEDREKIKEIKKKIRVHVRGYLAEYNADNGTNFVVEEFDFDRTGELPLKYKVKAYLNPPARTGDDDPETGGGHLIPPEPPKPGNNL